MCSVRAAEKRRTGTEINPKVRYPFHTEVAIQSSFLRIRARTPYPSLLQPGEYVQPGSTIRLSPCGERLDTQLERQRLLTLQSSGAYPGQPLLPACAKPLVRKPTSDLQIVSFFTVLGDVQSLDLMLLANTQPEKRIDDFQNDQTPDRSQGNGNDDGDQLIEHLRAVPVDKPNREGLPLAIFKDGINGARGEDAREQCPHGAAYTVHTEGVERIVVPQHALYLRNHEVADDSGR